MESSRDVVNFRSPQDDSIVDPFLVEALHNPRHRLTILRMELDIQRFLDNPDQLQFEFPCFPTSYLRLAAHRVSHLYGLQTLVQDSGSDGQGNKIIVRKTAESKFPTIKLSEIPVKQSENDKTEQIKIVLKPRPIKANASNDSGAGMKRSPVRSVEERKEEYDRARARIFSSSSSHDFSDTSFHVSIDGKYENESFRNSTIDPEKNLNVNDLSTSSRVAIFRDREKDRTDPDYDRNYKRYVRSLPANQRFNVAPLSMHKFQPQFLQYEVGLSQMPRTLASISYGAPSTPAMTPFCAMGMSQTSREATYVPWPSAAMMYAHPYDQFRQAVVQAPYNQQALRCDYPQYH
ncbi:uncharacterized protein LOC126798694 [Argentina anserina]|uniref:uncharacterized protein LOC126798694 n=1 Tax=Argentina anserina TaxID=57926 RepID=UPI0021766EC0|nr:uncharacterized protein LOC126798694 [Potentilla anserina]